MAVLAAHPVAASHCPMLIHQIYAEAANRLDTAVHDARKKAADAARLHREGRHPEAELIAKEGLELLGVKPVAPHAIR